jgi:hypothetical protein
MLTGESMNIIPQPPDDNDNALEEEWQTTYKEYFATQLHALADYLCEETGAQPDWKTSLLAAVTWKDDNRDLSHLSKMLSETPIKWEEPCVISVDTQTSRCSQKNLNN